MRLSEEPERPLVINVVPAIDAIFAILAFFIISTLFLARSEGLPVNLPRASTAETQRKKNVTVTIQADGKIALDREPILLSNLEAGVRASVDPESKSTIVLQADERVPHGRVIAVMDRLRRVEGTVLAIATERPEATRQPPSKQPQGKPTQDERSQVGN